MKIEYYKYDAVAVRAMNMCRPSISEFPALASAQRTKMYLESNAVVVNIEDNPVYVIDYEERYEGEVDAYQCIYKNINKLFGKSGNIRGQKAKFYECTFDNVDFGDNCFYEIEFNRCVFKNCSISYSSDDRPRLKFYYCVLDQAFWRHNLISSITLSPQTNKVVGNPLFISDDIDDLRTTGNFPALDSSPPEAMPENRNGVGYIRICRAMGFAWDSPILQAGLTGGLISVNFNPLPDQTLSWIPSYACNENKRIVLFNNQDYVDLDGNRQNYFDKTITEITLDFTKNGLTKEDMASVKDIYENSDNEIRIYPDENDTNNYIVGRLSKSDLDYSKMINSYWDNGKIDDERFNGVRMVIRVTDDSHFTRSL